MQKFEDEIIRIYPNTPKFIIDEAIYGNVDVINRKVVARFWSDKFISLKKDEAFDEYGDFFGTDTKGRYHFGPDILSDSCLEFEDLKSYWGNSLLFAWQIKNLEVFDKPKQISEFYRTVITRKIDGFQVNCGLGVQISKPPQSWQYVYTNE